MTKQNELYTEYRDINLFTKELTIRERILVHIALLNLQTSVSKGETALLVSTTEIGDLADKFAK
jgi:hypothetical protein